MLVLGVCFWCGGGVIVWRGVHLLDEFLLVAIPVVAIGLIFMAVSLWLIHRVFLKVNPSLSDGNTVPLQRRAVVCSTPANCSTLAGSPVDRKLLRNSLPSNSQREVQAPGERIRC